MAAQSDDGVWVWIFLAGLGVWFAYDKWWKEDVAAPPAPLYKPYEPYPDGPLATLPDGTVWRMVWGKVKGPREARLAWVRSDHTKNKKVAARETMTLYTINCDTTGYRTLSIVDYDGAGKVLKSWGESVFTKDVSYPPPESYIENVVEGACLPRFDPPITIPPTMAKP